jgi:uncharacterized protein (DUF1501 family)
MKTENTKAASIKLIDRRTFLRQSIYSSLAAGVVGTIPMGLSAMECQLVDMPRTLVNFMLHGGADLRYLFMPAPNHYDQVYVNLNWNARRSLYSAEYPDYSSMFEDQYLLATDPLGGPGFGVHRSADWLKDEFEQGRVAIISNAYCSRNRRHDQSILNADAGSPELDVLNFDRSGWGGRLVEQLGSGANSIELGNSVSTFNKGNEPGKRLAQVIHARDMRDMALAMPDDGNAASNRNVMARALQSYYDVRGSEALQAEAPPTPYRVFFEHYEAVSRFGAAVDERLLACQPLPDALQNLTLTSADFAQQCRNLFDACQVPDVLGMGVMSMSYGGWDTHDNLANEAGSNLGDIFGANGGLATALQSLEQLPFLEAPAKEQLAFYFASDFGRQIVANGSAGTDHGRGTYSILMGQPVRGGVYGEMFPQRESNPSEDGRIPLQTPGADIEGLTSTDRILSRAADWIKPGAGPEVFPNAVNAGQEAGVNLDQLFHV